MKIPQFVGAVLRTLRENGYEAYIVGGSLRNLLLGKEPKDWDVTTSALPEQTLSACSGFKTLATGLQHGTITVISDGNPVEVTTFRIDGSYSDSRHPDSVEFTPSLRLDLERRDFTMNAMAFSEESGVVDCFGGEEDCRNGIIRCVGTPEKRFQEDALRILRAFRFMSELGFEIEENTLSAAKKCASELNLISRERVYAELVRTLLGLGASRAVSLMQRCGVLSYVIPNSEKISKNAPLRISCLPFHLPTRLAALIFELDKDTAEAILTSLKMSNADKASTKKLLSISPDELIPSTYDSIRFLRKYGELLPNALSLATTLFDIDISNFEEKLDDIKRINPPLKTSELSVNGKEISEAFNIHGEEIGKALDFLMEYTALYPSDNKKNTLLTALYEHLKEKNSTKGDCSTK